MVSFSTIVSISTFVLPILLPRVIALYRSIKTASHGPHSQVRPPPPRVKRSLNILWGCVFVFLLLSFPNFAPSNIFQETKSRLLLQTNLLVHRLHTFRQGNLTALDQALIARFENEPNDIRLLYAAYGPNVVAECPFCKASEPQSYLYYALPSIVAAHLVHIIFLGAITSSFFSGPEGLRWRTYATISGVALGAGELWLIYNHDWEANRTKRMPQDTDFFYWRMRIYRLLAFASLDGLLGWTLWLTSSNRWLVKPPSVSQQMVAASQILQTAYNQLNVLGNLQNAVLRDQKLRELHSEYWAREHAEMDEIEREREVVDAKNIALSRMDYDRVQGTAENYVEQVFPDIRPTVDLGQGHDHDA